jgi:hypothetical protein
MGKHIIRMRKVGSLVPGALALAIALLHAPGGRTAPSAAPDAPDGYRPLPWHLVDLFWVLDKPLEVERLSLDVDILTDPPLGHTVFIAGLSAHLNGDQSYTGWMTNLQVMTADGQDYEMIGPGFIFSHYGERSPLAIRPSTGGHRMIYESEERCFVSVRPPYKWAKGKYTVEIVRMDRERVGEDTYVWVGSFVRRQDTNERCFVGSIRYKGASLTCSNEICTFLEVAGYEKDRPKTFPEVSVSVSNLRIDGKLAPLRDVVAVYREKVPQCGEALLETPRRGASADDGPAVRIDLGKRLIDREPGTVRLYSAR